MTEDQLNEFLARCVLVVLAVIVAMLILFGGK